MSNNAPETFSIMIIEDEEKIAKILMTYLDLYPKFTSFVWARDGVEAMQKLTNQQFDLIITDIVLPKRDGITFLETLRKFPKYYKQKIIVVSGCLTQDLALRCIKNDVKHIIVKPFTAREILLKSMAILKSEKNPTQVVDTILEKMAKRFMVKEAEGQQQQSIIDEDVRELIDMAINDEMKRKK